MPKPDITAQIIEELGLAVEVQVSEGKNRNGDTQEFLNASLTGDGIRGNGLLRTPEGGYRRMGRDDGFCVIDLSPAAVEAFKALGVPIRPRGSRPSRSSEIPSWIRDMCGKSGDTDAE